MKGSATTIGTAPESRREAARSHRLTEYDWWTGQVRYRGAAATMCWCGAIKTAPDDGSTSSICPNRDRSDHLVVARSQPR